MDELTVDWAVVGYTVVVALVVAVSCGVLPALRAGRSPVARSLAGGTRAQVSSRHALQWLLVGAQIALSVVLLAGAGLLVRSLQELGRVDAGFDPRQVLTFRVSGHYGETVDYARLTARIDDTMDALRALPGVEAAASSRVLPGVPNELQHTFTIVEARSEAGRQAIAERLFVSPEYFETMRIPIVAGEPCARRASGTTRSVIVNEAFHSRYLSSWTSPIGLHLAASADLDQAARIVAVAANARDHGIDRDPAPAVYACISAPTPTPYFLLRTQGDPLALVPLVRVAMRERDPLRSVYDIAPLDARIGGAFAQDRLRTRVLTSFAAIALALAGIGLYGTLTYVVNLRRREIALRLALGAVRAAIVRQFFAQGLKVTAIAGVAGVVAALLITRVLEGMLFGVSPTDPLVMSLVVAIVLAVSIAGALIPALRASAIEPMRLLRDD
jgi:putative ABC transport system permease protein